jgi:tetratricopeptide (TPR) repeat protein
MNRSFAWTDPMLRIYADFCRQRLAVRLPPRYVDAANGGFYLLDYDLSAQSRPASPLFFLPTAESAIWIGRSLADQIRFPESAREIERVMETTGKVGNFVSYQADAYYYLQDWRRVHDLLYPYFQTGLVDRLNLPRLGEAAAQLGRYDSAVAILQRCLTLYSTAMPNRVILAWTYVKRAQLHMRENRLSQARADLDRADETIFAVPSDPGDSYEHSRILVFAELLGTRGDLLEAQGRPREARDCYRKALKLAPEAPQFARWRRLLGSD